MMYKLLKIKRPPSVLPPGSLFNGEVGSNDSNFPAPVRNDDKIDAVAFNELI